MPVSTGVNVIVIVQLFEAARLEPQVFVWMAKSVLGWVIEIPLVLMFSGASPIFERVTVAGLLFIFTLRLPNETNSGLRLTLGDGSTVCVIAGEVLVTKLPSPLYTAVTLSGPLSGRLAAKTGKEVHQRWPEGQRTTLQSVARAPAHPPTTVHARSD